MAELSFKLRLTVDDATKQIRAVGAEADSVKNQIEAPKVFKINAEQALATIRDLNVAFDGVAQVIRSAAMTLNSFLDANLKQKQAMQLTTLAFGDAAKEMSDFATQMQQVTNFGDDDLLPLMAKLSTTYKLGSADVKALTMGLLDFTEANKATGMSVESAFDLMGRALNGHTEMLGRYGIQLDKNRLQTEGVSYLVEKLTQDYSGTAVALADLRTQNKNVWGDIREEVGGMIEELITPLLMGLREVMAAFQGLNPIAKGFVTGLAVAIPVIASVTTAIVTLTAAFHALKIAINPVVGLIGLGVSVLAGIGFAFAASAQSSKQFETQTKETTKSVEELVSQHRAIAMSIDYAEAKKRLKEVENSLKQYQQTLKDTAAEMYKLTGAAFNEAQKKRSEEKKAMAEVAAEAQALRERIAAEDAAAAIKFNQEKRAIERKAALEGVALLEYTLAEAKRNYAALGKVTADNVDDQLLALETIRNLEKQISQEKEREIQDKAKADAEAAKNKLALEQEKFRAEIEYMSNLQQLGVASYEQLKQTMEEYYAWAKQYLTKEEQAMILLQLRQANLRWGEYRQREAEEEWSRLRGLAEIREEFSDRDLELAENTYQLQLLAIERYYKSRRAKLIEAGLTEVEIERQKAKAIEQIEKQAKQSIADEEQKMRQNLMTASTMFGKKGFEAYKILAQTQAVIDTYASATAAYKAMVGIPVVGPGLAITAAAAAIAAGLANVRMIEKQEFVPKMAEGGQLSGPSHANGGILIEAEGDEYITAKDRVRALGKGLFDFLNFAPIGDVYAAISNMRYPSLPMPSPSGMVFATGGSVGASGSVIDAIMMMKDELVKALQDNRPVIGVHVDPLSNDPVKVSEIAERGSMIRSGV